MKFLDIPDRNIYSILRHENIITHRVQSSAYPEVPFLVYALPYKSAVSSGLQKIGVKGVLEKLWMGIWHER